jgi:hypothetical protein
MELTREYLEAKRAELVEQYERNMANANAASGGMQTIDALLARLEEPED